MKVGIYGEFCEGFSMGGGEVCLAALADALQHEHEVEIIVHDAPNITPEGLSKHTGFSLSNARIRRVPRDPSPFKARYNLKNRRCSARDWHRELSEPYDLFVSVVHGIPPFNHAKTGVLYVLFPFFDPARPFWGETWDQHAGRVLGRAMRAFDATIWRERVASYTKRAAISEFSAHWSERLWGTPFEVVYPPVALLGNPAPERSKKVLSIGRYTTVGNQKRQREMVAAFREIESQPDAGGWTMECVGNVSSNPEDQKYFADVQAIAGERVCVRAGVERAEVEALCRSASLYWHAAGYGLDPEAEAEARSMEHFGITTVEAMSAGCVPLVVRRGGQPEIVQHGVSGFTWETLEEMTEYTLLLMRDPDLKQRMSAAAIERSERFSRERYAAYFRNIIAAEKARG